jgi:hypothetical protein
MAGDGPYYCFEGKGPGTGGCSAGEICSGGKCIPYTGPGGGGGVETLVDHHIPVSAHGEHLFRTNLVLARRITVYRVSYILMKIIVNTLNEYLYKMSDVKKRLYSLS